MSLKLLANKVLLREHLDEQEMNTAEKGVHLPVNTPFFVVEAKSEEMPGQNPLSLEGSRDLSESASWLHCRLITGPQRIGDLMREWCESVRGQAPRVISARIDLLNDARGELSVEPYIGADGRYWWRER